MTVFDHITNPKRCFFIAEIGSNHDGDFDTALRLMDVANNAGADAVKFQSFLADHLVKPDSPDYDLLRRIELKREWYPRLKAEAEARGLVFFSTATNDITLGWMEEIGVELYKIASPNLTYLPLIRKAASFGKPVIMSTGMAGLLEIDEAVRTYTATGNQQLALLYCVSEYPANPRNVNLSFIAQLAALYPYPIGYSDHTLDIGTAIAAVALGARVIEKHLTLNRNNAGPDHHYALEAEEFITMGRNIRIVEQTVGHGPRHPSPEEREKSSAYWRSLHARRDLRAGEVLRAEDIQIVRPNDGLHPRHLEAVTGIKVTQDIPAGKPLTWNDFKA
jgi:sialic acid synthase SpsE